MMKKSVLVVSLVCLLGAPWCAASPDLSGDTWQLSLRKDGTIEQLACSGTVKEVVPFGGHQKPGPVFYVSYQRDDALRSVVQNQTIGAWKARWFRIRRLGRGRQRGSCRLNRALTICFAR